MATCSRLHDLFLSDGLNLTVKLKSQDKPIVYPAADIEFATVSGEGDDDVVLVPDLAKQGDTVSKGAYFLKVAASAKPSQKRGGETVKNLLDLVG
jgi:hypothetical protein